MEAVIFDFDGVIGDTMSDNCRAWQQAFSQFGISISPLEYYKLEGMGPSRIAQHFISVYDLDTSIEREIVLCKEAYYHKNNSFKVYDFVHDIFQLLKNNDIPIGLVTGASRKRLETHLAPEIKQALSVIITSDDVVNTKPHPEPYTNAVNSLGKKAEDCIVVENALLGIQSAKAAGCTCFAIATTLTPSLLKDADEVYSNHQQLYQGLNKHILRN